LFLYRQKDDFVRHNIVLRCALVGGLLCAFSVLASASDSQADLVRLHETVRVSGVILKGVSEPSQDRDVPAGEYSYVRLDYPIDFVDSGDTANGPTYRHQQELGLGASSTAMAVSLGQNYGKHVVLTGHINASIDTQNIAGPFDLQFDVTKPLEIVGQGSAE
jgi:hypothetical protein